MPVQDHIHLSATIGSGPEFAPNLRWTATNRVLIPSFTVEVVESLVGNRFDFATEGVVYHDMMYELILRDTSDSTALEKVNALLGLAGKRLFLVDHVHPDNGESHSSSVMNVRMTKMDPIEPQQQMLQLFRARIYLSRLTAGS